MQQSTQGSTAAQPVPANVTSTFDPRLRNLANRKICSSLLLQQILYYTVLWDIGWLAYWAWFIFDQYWVGLLIKDNDIVRTVFFVLWFISEPIRLAAGFYGNLHENLPWLLMFTVLTFVPQEGTIVYLYMGSFRRRAYTKAIQIVQLVLQNVALVTGVYAVFRMYKQQKKQYFLFEYALNQRARAQQRAREARQTQQALR